MSSDSFYFTLGKAKWSNLLKKVLRRMLEVAVSVPASERPGGRRSTAETGREQYPACFIAGSEIWLCNFHLLWHKIIQDFPLCDIVGTKMQVRTHLLPIASWGSGMNAGLPNVKGKSSFQQDHRRSRKLCHWAPKVKLSKSSNFPSQIGALRFLLLTF